MIAKTLKVQNLTPGKSGGKFMQMCQDILASETSRVGSKTNQSRVKEIVRELVAKEIGMKRTIHVGAKTVEGIGMIKAVDGAGVEEKKESENLAAVTS